MKTLKTLLVSATVVLSTSFAMAAEKITYAFPAPDFLLAFSPFKIAEHKGYFKDAGLDVKFRIAKGGADVATQVAAGNVDLGGGIGDTSIIVRSNGLKVRGVALLGGRGLTQLAYREDANIKSIKDLKGKSIGVLSFQDTTYYNLLGVLKSAGLSKNDVNIQGVGPGGLIKLTIAGKLDAFVGVPEWIGAVKGAGIAIRQEPVENYFPAMAQAIIASDKMIAERPEAIQKFVGAIMKALKYVASDPVNAAKDYVKFVPRYKGKEKQVEGTMRAYGTLIYAESSKHKLGTFYPPRVEEVQKFYKDSGIIQRTTPINELYTNQFVQ